MSRLYLICVPAYLFLVQAVAAQEFVTDNIMQSSTQISAEFDIDSLSWLVGSWRGEALGGIAEELWMPPSGGTMLGLLKITRGEETVFSELMSIVPSGNSIKMLVKHFNADLTGWEEKNEVESFEFVAADDSSVYFNGLTIRRGPVGQISIYVLATDSEGNISELTFDYEAVRTP